MTQVFVAACGVCIVSSRVADGPYKNMAAVATQWCAVYIFQRKRYVWIDLCWWRWKRGVSKTVE